MQWSEVTADRIGPGAAFVISPPPIATSDGSFGRLLSVTWKIKWQAPSATWHAEWKPLPSGAGHLNRGSGARVPPQRKTADAVDWGDDRETNPAHRLSRCHRRAARTARRRAGPPGCRRRRRRAPTHPDQPGLR